MSKAYIFTSRFRCVLQERRELAGQHAFFGIPLPASIQGIPQRVRHPRHCLGFLWAWRQNSLTYILYDADIPFPMRIRMFHRQELEHAHAKRKHVRGHRRRRVLVFEELRGVPPDGGRGGERDRFTDDVSEDLGEPEIGE